MDNLTYKEIENIVLSHPRRNERAKVYNRNYLQDETKRKAHRLRCRRNYHVKKLHKLKKKLEEAHKNDKDVLRMKIQSTRQNIRLLVYELQELGF